MPTAPRRRSTRWPRTSRAFLVWTAEPKLERRHASGLAVVLFLLIATVLGYLAYRNIWAEAKRKVRVTGPLDPKNQAKVARAKGERGSPAEATRAARPGGPCCRSVKFLTDMRGNASQLRSSREGASPCVRLLRF